MNPFLDRTKLTTLLEQEEQLFHTTHPKSFELYQRAHCYMHFFALNRGILMTPFHHMALVSSDTTREDVDYHTKVFREAVQSLLT